MGVLSNSRIFCCCSKGASCQFGFLLPDSMLIFLFVCKRHEVTQHGIVWEQYEAGKERDIMGFYHCRMSCDLVFSTKSTRNRYEETINLTLNIVLPSYPPFISVD